MSVLLPNFLFEILFSFLLLFWSLNPALRQGGQVLYHCAHCQPREGGIPAHEHFPVDKEYFVE
jgi:hypothetical protein